MTALFTEEDREQLRRHGIGLDEARRQVDALRQPPPYTCLDRPCTPGDGILVLGTEECGRLAGLHDEAVGAGRVLRFVPASGAATRMFRDLIACRADPALRTRRGVEEAARAGRREALALRDFMAGLHRLAFREELDGVLHGMGSSLHGAIEGGRYGLILDGLLGPEGLGYAALPKGLLKFHAGAGGGRTPFEEHLAEMASLHSGRAGSARLHFTVSPEHRGRFASLLENARGTPEREHNLRFEVGFSVQKRSTDTLALGHDGLPFRLDDGTLLLRPSGHGALLENLQDLEADLAFIKNIDNVTPDHLRGPSLRWCRALTGLLVEAQRECRKALGLLEAGPGDGPVQAAAALIGRRFGVMPARSSREDLRRLLDRPIRVCGMVKNLGDPGGGPFWVRNAAGGTRPQIVESTQVDPGSPAQQALLKGSTHFNPVLIACGLRDHQDRPFDLRRFVDAEARIVTTKSFQGRPLTAMERPGLWNGAMAGWNTVFVEVPREAFTPAKTVNDLLRPEHQPA